MYPNVSHMQGGRVLKGAVFGELATGSRPAGRPFLRYKDVYNRHMTAASTNQAGWEASAPNHSRWRLVVKEGIKTGKQNREDQWAEKRERRRQRTASDSGSSSTEPSAKFTCSKNFKTGSWSSLPAANATEPIVPVLDCTATIETAINQTNPRRVLQLSHEVEGCQQQKVPLLVT